MSQILGKLHIPDEVDEDKIRTLKLLVNNLQRVRTVRFRANNSCLTMFDSVVL